MQPTQVAKTTSRNIVLFTKLGLVAGCMAAAVLLAPSGVQARSQTADGAEGYATHCASCHQAGGEGLEGTFPPLLGNPAATDPDYVRDVVVNGQSGPIEVLGVAYDSEMPAVVALEGAELDAVVAYVVDLAGPATDDAEAADPEPDPELSVEPIAANADRGHDFFIGSSRFENGGAPCAGCHTAGNISNLGGYSLGPDLTDSVEQLGGAAGLNGWLANPPSATMAPIFADKPMTEGEIADLVAFLDTAPAEADDQTVDRLLVAGVGGVIVLFSILALIWQGNRQTYVERLRSKR